ncbi:hypothetical protein HPB51_006924 [Rhipicephalus microplus]|uniref:ARMC5-like ARM-repeats domain-containing protein n=1 Tax=Rhipicephalus microplus TaxID=6941 RepID=A0A9J6EY44_RHIMP|nr:hypothetical protein HPB51_006924 [Rhipicephalus microplus]
MTSRGAKEIHSCKAVEHIVTFLTSPTSCESQVTALRAVRILANAPECRDDLVALKAPAAAVKSLQSEALQKHAVQALASLTQSCSLECALQIKDADGFKALEELLQVSESAVLESAFAALANLSVVGDVRPDLGAAQAISALIKQLTDYKLAKPNQENNYVCEAYKARSEATDYDDATEQALNQEASSELSRYPSKNTFCIHSPSYREIERQNLGLDVGGYCSDLGYHSNPASPDHARRPVSPLLGAWSPSSTDSGLWSPCSTPRCDSPVSVASPEPFRSFSPICSENDSDSEQPIPSYVKNMVESVCRDIPKKTEFIKRKRSSLCDDQITKASGHSRGTEDDSPPSRAKRRRRRTLSESVTFAYKDSQEMLLDGMFKILTVFSLIEMPEYKLGSTGLFEGLMRYLYDVPSPLQRASHIMSKITSNLHSFEEIVCKGEVLRLVESMVACGLKGCKHCRQFRDLGRHWLSNLTHVAESGYGSGVLAHCLLTQSKEIQNWCCLTIPYIVRDKSILRQLLFDCLALDALLDILEEGKCATDKTFRQAVDSLAALCTSISERRTLLKTCFRRVDNKVHD